ncbi:MAG: LuxR C-terminal-related transcriptional regulator [Thermomicrobiales bacterium]
MSTFSAELSEAWTLRRRSVAQMYQQSPSYRLDFDRDREFQESAPSAEAPGVQRNGPQETQFDKRLTCRELQVIELVATGATDQEIADTLFISRRTVTSHMASILTKLGVGNRTAAAVYAARTGLIV